MSSADTRSRQNTACSQTAQPAQTTAAHRPSALQLQGEEQEALPVPKRAAGAETVSPETRKSPNNWRPPPRAHGPGPARPSRAPLPAGGRPPGTAPQGQGLSPAPRGAGGGSCLPRPGSQPPVARPGPAEPPLPAAPGAAQPPRGRAGPQGRPPKARSHRPRFAQSPPANTRRGRGSPGCPGRCGESFLSGERAGLGSVPLSRRPQPAARKNACVCQRPRPRAPFVPGSAARGQKGPDSASGATAASLCSALLSALIAASQLPGCKVGTQR